MRRTAVSLDALDPEGGRLVLLVFLGGEWATGQAADQRLYGISPYTEGRSGGMPGLRGEHPRGVLSYARGLSAAYAGAGAPVSSRY